ncbi:LPS assembly lipoprotein LptE [Albidovulum sediminicola]|uniref:LPS assembly lipoprotein LptE n=1 Tax=Albidovulum sediminicola TaxID=2984331 RepID=A0ABT2YYK6_9RHOB|nr:LPS assembly lipoprotein LptE [Defluviimonas sp. WL0075]MCV2863944.1 LPS assembly lipoprotein LptE [Defluviimonas sp. WL0075]
MSWSDRRQFLSLLAALPLAACGFRPAYGPGGAAAGMLDSVSVEAPEDRNGFDLVERLEERLGRTKSPVYRLSYRIETGETGLGITPEDTTTRFNIDGSVAFVLRDAATGRELTAGKVATFTAYSATGTAVSTETARAAAYQRLMRLLADQIVTRLLATSTEWRDA